MIEPSSFFWAAFVMMIFLLGLFSGWLILAITRCNVSINSVEPAGRKLETVTPLEALEDSVSNFSGKK